MASTPCVMRAPGIFILPACAGGGGQLFLDGTIVSS